jgi:hypothetical protein
VSGSFKLNGVAALKRTLSELNSESATKVGTVALREGAKIMKDGLVSTDSPHQLKFSVGVGRAFWGLFQELGTVKMAARPWMRPAFDAFAPLVIQNMAKLLGTGITREAKRLGRKAKKLGL